MNEHDSEKIAGIFELDGMTKATIEESADIMFINTCTIRENADDRLYGTLGQLKKWKDEGVDRKLLVGGCAAQKDKQLVRERAPWVDVVIATHNLTNIINLLNQSEDWGPITKSIYGSLFNISVFSACATHPAIITIGFFLPSKVCLTLPIS